MSGAARTREYRQRLKAGKIIIEIEVDEAMAAEAFWRRIPGFPLEPGRDDLAAVINRAVNLWIEEELS
jgi:hypothetical protein